MTHDFEEAYAAYKSQMRRLSHSQVVPGLDPDDVFSEMSVCLWRATQSWDGNRPFGTLWWSIWLNRRNDLLRHSGRQRRVHPWLVEDLDDLDSEIRDKYRAALHDDPIRQMVWDLLSEGDTGLHIREALELSVRQYNAMIKSWRTDDIKGLLEDS